MHTRLTWICHGATAASRDARFPLDEPLEEKAVGAARAMAPALPRADRVFSSPALRARQTTDALRLEATTDQALRDCGYGRWAGRSIASIQDEEPDALSAWMTDPDAAPHGGETLADLRERTSAWMTEQAARGGHVIAVTHAEIIRSAVAHVLQAPLSAFWLNDVEPLASLHMTSNGRRWSLRFPAWRPPL